MEEGEPTTEKKDDSLDPDEPNTSDTSGLIDRGRTTIGRYCSAEAWKKRLPVLSWAPSYKPAYIFYDVLSGVITAFTEIPQALAYAAIAGLSYEVSILIFLLSFSGRGRGGRGEGT